MKKLLLIVLIATLMVVSFSAITGAGAGMHLHLGDTLLSPDQTLLGAIVAGAGFILLGGVLAVSLFSVIFIVLATVFVALLVVGLSAFWPAILLMLLGYAILRGNKGQPVP